MRILTVVPWDQEYGGVASVVGNLARYLESQGHILIFLHPGEANRLKKKITKWGFTGFELNMRRPFSKEHPVRSIVAFLSFFLVTMFQLIWVIRRHQIQIVNIHYPLEGFVYFAICRWLLSIKLVISVHGADLFPEGQRLRKYPWGLRFLLFSSNSVVAPSKAFLEDFLSVFPHLTGKGSFIHNGINIHELQEADKSNSLVNKERYILCVAAHNEKKGLDVLLRAFGSLMEVDRTLRMELVGDGPLRGQCELLAKTIAVDDRVEFLGSKGRSDVVRLLHGCEVFVLPSRSEPFGVVIIEAMACQKPVVASAVGGIREIIENGKSGILVEPNNPIALANALLSLLQDDSLRKSMGRNGYARVVEFFQCKHTGAKYEGLFSHLLEGSLSFGIQRART